MNVCAVWSFMSVTVGILMRLQREHASRKRTQSLLRLLPPNMIQTCLICPVQITQYRSDKSYLIWLIAFYLALSAKVTSPNRGSLVGKLTHYIYASAVKWSLSPWSKSHLSEAEVKVRERVWQTVFRARNSGN